MEAAKSVQRTSVAGSANATDRSAGQGANQGAPRGGLKVQLRALDYAAGVQMLAPGGGSEPTANEAGAEVVALDNNLGADEHGAANAAELDADTRWRVKLAAVKTRPSADKLKAWGATLGTAVVVEGPDAAGFIRLFVGDFATAAAAEGLCAKAKGIADFASPTVVSYTPTVKEATDPLTVTVKKSVVDAAPAAGLAALQKADAGARATTWAAVTNAERKSLVSILVHGTLTDDVLQGLFDATPDGDLATIKKLFEVRFDLTVGQVMHPQYTGADFDAVGLRRGWGVLKTLPEEHVRGNAALENWTRYDGSGGSGGFYWATKKEISQGYTTATIGTELLNGADVGDPLYQVVFFDETVRHEIGHATDASVGGSAYAKTAKGAEWKDHGAPDGAFVQGLAKTSAGAISNLDPLPQTLVATAIANAMASDKPDETKKNIENLTKPAKEGEEPLVDLDAKTLTDIYTDPVVETSVTSGWGKAPWFNAPGNGVDIGGRMYQAVQAGSWGSFAQGALARKVSRYQFRSAAEWFAEAYAAYFHPDGNGKFGAKLSQADAGSKTWFDENVLPKEKKKEEGGK